MGIKYTIVKTNQGKILVPSDMVEGTLMNRMYNLGKSLKKYTGVVLVTNAWKSIRGKESNLEEDDF